MPRKTTANTMSAGWPVLAVLAGLAAWLLPGAGHWMLGRRVRAVILFATIQGLFWSGVAIGGVFTVDPGGGHGLGHREVWWSRAQLLTGLSGVWSYRRQQATYNALVSEAVARRIRDESLEGMVRRLAAEKDLALVAPAAGPARVYSGVAGMLNLLCIIDVVLLAALGARGEPVRPSRHPAEASA